LCFAVGRNRRYAASTALCPGAEAARALGRERAELEHRARAKQEQNPVETIAYRMAARMFESAFAACERLPETSRQLLLREIGKRILKNISPPPTEAVKRIEIVGVEIKQQNSLESN
jgi:DNA polymerase I-like protein with 3'-5' exonuclease and polymerase domains